MAMRSQRSEGRKDAMLVYGCTWWEVIISDGLAGSDFRRWYNYVFYLLVLKCSSIYCVRFVNRFGVLSALLFGSLCPTANRQRGELRASGGVPSRRRIGRDKGAPPHTTRCTNGRQNDIHIHAHIQNPTSQYAKHALIAHSKHEHNIAFSLSFLPLSLVHLTRDRDSYPTI